MKAYFIHEARQARGITTLDTPMYSMKLWDDDKDNDGSSDGFFGAPSMKDITNVAVSVAAYSVGAGPLVTAAINLIDDAVFTMADVATGYQQADTAFANFGVSAGASLAGASVGGVFNGFDGASNELLSGGLNEMIGESSNQLTNVAVDVGMGAAQSFTSNAASGAISSMSYDGDWSFNSDTYTDGLIGRSALASYAGGAVGTAVTGTLNYSVDGTLGREYSQVAALNSTLGSAANAGLQYGMTGSTTLNVLNAADVSGGSLQGGLLELNIGGDGPVMNLGTGGVSMSAVQAVRGVGGIQTHARNLRIASNGYLGEEAVAARMLATSGVTETETLFDQLMGGEAELAYGGTAGRAETKLTDGLKTIHLGEGAGEGSRYQLGLTLSHEAFRDGVNNGSEGQYRETVSSVIGHSLVAQQVGAIYGEGNLTGMQQEEVKLLEALQRSGSGDMSDIAAHVAANYDSSADYWKLTADGDLVYDGDGYLKDEAGNYINADGSRTARPSDQTIGAAGVETGLLNILHGGSSNVSYDSYSTGQKLVAQNLMTQAGILGSDAGYEERMWAGVQTATLVPLEAGEINLTAFNDGKSLNMRSVLRRRGETVATEVFANYFYEEADTVAKGIMNETYRGQTIGALSGMSLSTNQRFGSFTNTLYDLYDGGVQQAETLSKLQNGGFGPSDIPGHKGIHKGNDFPMAEGTSVPAIFSGMLSGIDSTDDYNPLTGDDSSGKDVRMRVGFMFEDTFIDTGVDANAFHLSSIAEGLSAGDYLSSGDALGKAGHTGYVIGDPGDHLHQEFTLRKFLGNPTTEVPNPYRVRQSAFLDFVGAPGLDADVPTRPEDWANRLNYWHEDRYLYYINANDLF